MVYEKRNSCNKLLRYKRTLILKVTLKFNVVLFKTQIKKNK